MRRVMAQGVAPLLAFAFLSASVDVYAGNRLQEIEPMALAAVSFTLTAAVFIGVEYGRTGRASLRPLRTKTYDVVALNVMTALTWLSLLFALKYLEPAVVNVVSIAMGPACIVVLGPLLRRGSSLLVLEIATSLGILGLIVVLTWGSFTGQSAVGDIGSRNVVLGMTATIVCGVASTGNVIYSKRLSEGGLAPRSVLAVRFYLMMVVSWIGLALTENPALREALVPAVVVTVIGVATPMYLVQLGVRHAEPITVTLLLSLAPVLTYLLQFLDGRLETSGLSLACILGITAMVAAGVYGRGRHESRADPASEALP